MYRNGIPYKTIGNNDLTTRRSGRIVTLPPFGNLGDFVPFYFCTRSVMLYQIYMKSETTYGGGQEPIVHLRCSVSRFMQEHLRFFFTDRHAHAAFATQFNDINDIDKLDWDVIESKWWKNTPEDNDRMSRKQAEFLVHNFVPWNCVHDVGVFNARYQSDAREILARYNDSTPVHIRTGYYY